MKRTASFLIVFIAAIAAISLVADSASAAPQSQVDPEYYDLLVLGVDRRPYQKTGRSDVMLIVHCEPDRITFFSIPRDSLVTVRGNKDKLNHAFAYGQTNLTISTIEDFLEFKVDNYIVVDFETFLKTVDIVKKLTDDGRLIGAENFLMSGENLLKWLRFRTLPKGDRRRCQRHQLFMKRVFEYALGMYNNQRTLFGQVLKASFRIVETDLTYDHAEKLLETYKNVDLEKNLERFVLPGSAEARYRDNTSVSQSKYEARHMPNFMNQIATEGLTGEDATKRLNALRSQWRGKHALVNYYVPKYDWSLVTYVNWFRKSGISINYEEVDTLRK